MRKRLIVLVSLLLVGMLALSACGAPAGEEAPVVEEPPVSEESPETEDKVKVFAVGFPVLDRPVDVPPLLGQVPQAVPGARRLGVEGDGFLESLLGVEALALVELSPAQAVPGVGIGGIGLDGLAEAGLGLGQLLLLPELPALGVETLRLPPAGRGP